MLTVLLLSSSLRIIIQELSLEDRTSDNIKNTFVHRRCNRFLLYLQQGECGSGTGRMDRLALMDNGSLLRNCVHVVDIGERLE